MNDPTQTAPQTPPTPPTAPLTSAELDALDTFLASLPAGAMNVEMFDGFCCALHCTPDLIGPAVWLPLLWGETADAEASFDDEGQARAIVGLVTRHWSAVAEELVQADAADTPRVPRLSAAAQGRVTGNAWATGFTRGMQVSPESWQAVLGDDAAGEVLVPMMMLHHEHDPDEAMRPPPFDDAVRSEVIEAMVMGAAQLYRHFGPARRAASRADRQALTFRREGAKPGRNDPCACGSGKKFKACCGRT
jgi:uncharacterized protein